MKISRRPIRNDCFQLCQLRGQEVVNDKITIHYRYWAVILGFYSLDFYKFLL